MESKGLGDCARQPIKEMSTVRSMDVVLAARSATEAEAVDLRLRVVARPDKIGANCSRTSAWNFSGHRKSCKM